MMRKTVDKLTGRTTTQSRPTSVSLPVRPATAPTIRPSRMSRLRALSLISVHLLILAHIAHWLATGRTVSPVEPSEAMYTLNDGYLNAGFIFFGVALLATLLLGRFVCGWGCHLIAYQDLCAWLMKRIGIKPKPFRSRLLVFAPLALALYMFVWPTAYRWWLGRPAPALSNHILKTNFWETFPGPGIAVLTVAVCGFVIVYLLGGKGFCTYACPYGGFFRLAEPLAAARIVVTDACRHCGHCTATCTSNVRVHEEVALYGMVVDPGCMKCMDCVSVCPNDALYFGFKKPSLGAKPVTPRRAPRYDFTLWEEVAMVLVGVAALLSYRGLYGHIPLLLSMALAALTAYFVVKFIRLLRASNVRLQNLQLKRGGRWTRAGIVVGMLSVTLFVFTAHSGAVQYQSWRGHLLMQSAAIGDEVWSPGGNWWQRASPEQRAVVEAAIERFERTSRWGLLPTPSVLRDSVLLYLARGRDDDAERAVRGLIDVAPNLPDAYRGLAGVMRKTGRFDEAEQQYRRALALDPGFAPARRELASLLVALGRPHDAITLYKDAIKLSPRKVSWRLALGNLLAQSDRAAEAADVFEAAIELDPSSAQAHYGFGMALLARRRLDAALEQLQTAVAQDASFALAHYNLGVATFMDGRPADALPHIREAIHLDPTDPDAYGFLAVVLRELGDTKGAQQAAEQFRRLGG